MQRPDDPIRHELVTWRQVDKIVDTLVPQIKSVTGFDGIVLVTRGGIIPGGLLAEALDITYILTAAVHFTETYYSESSEPRLSPRLALPSFLQFPEKRLLEGRQLLMVDDVWGSGRTSTAVKGRLEAANASVFTCVFHYNPYRSLFTDAKPDFYGAITDAYITYPWEADRGVDGIGRQEPEFY